jgi:hypothetical protein
MAGAAFLSRSITRLIDSRISSTEGSPFLATALSLPF